jgi:hypothetical protein
MGFDEIWTIGFCDRFYNFEQCISDDLKCNYLTYAWPKLNVGDNVRYNKLSVNDDIIYNVLNWTLVMVLRTMNWMLAMGFKDNKLNWMSM